MEKGTQGCHLQVSLMASAAGEATAYFGASASSSTGLGSINAEHTSSQQFGPGNAQVLRFHLPDAVYQSILGITAEDERRSQIVVDLCADEADASSIKTQRSMLRLHEDKETVQVVRQTVQVGSITRNLEALYGTMPNAKAVSGGGSPVERSSGNEDPDGGDCVICLSKPRDVAILHCRHVCLCTSCAKITSSTWSFQCPVCRGRVAAMVGLASST